ncbi:MAG: hypothetical protein R3B82_21225 [Sandaracinaceae bacterium]
MTYRGLACSLLLVGLAASPAEAQEMSDRSPRIAANLALGLAGELDLYSESNAGSLHSDADLDPSVGFDLRGELPLLDFLVLGGWFEFLSFETDTSGSEREESFSFDVFLRVRYVFEAIANTLFIEPYVLFPFGFSMAVLPDDDGSGDDIWPGFNTGVFAGAQILHESGFGGYLELGWRHAEVFHDRTILGADVHQSLVANEMALNFGFVYAL